ncbi:uncharacterized protein LOC111274266 [Durio zibethinus]|uniref:Uncharacterized protein LOC111274266 n=1 Tax=Durio zibethinus TaxID=66656 RepID=A0A6P5WEW4_DURZI|nr:uncharacterized protein LOC111274266 [Durio zibethinus]
MLFAFFSPLLMGGVILPSRVIGLHLVKRNYLENVTVVLLSEIFCGVHDLARAINYFGDEHGCPVMSIPRSTAISLLFGVDSFPAQLACLRFHSSVFSQHCEYSPFPAISNDQDFISELEIQIPNTFDPFTDANSENSGAGAKEYVHVRVQQRNGRKSLTTIQGLKKEFSYSKIIKDLKKEFCCNGTVVQVPELGQVIQLQGDQRKNVSTFLIQAGIAKKEHIKIHGF